MFNFQYIVLEEDIKSYTCRANLEQELVQVRDGHLYLSRSQCELSVLIEHVCYVKHAHCL